MAQTPEIDQTLPDPQADPPVVPLNEPADGVPLVITTPQGLVDAADRLSSGTGPVAVDAERASGYRYGQRAFLVQMRRTGSGTILIDPTAFDDLTAINTALGDTEWVFHAASQDLPCLAELDLHPPRLFDTEVASRLLGFQRVGLAPVVASVLGLGLAKEHSAVDWSQRPLPTDWLRYAALDVEVLVELRNRLAAMLADAEKTDMADQEFEHIRIARPAAPRQDPWRRTSGIHAVRDPRTLAIVRELWFARDRIARERDVSPGRVLPDSAIITAATRNPASVPELLALPGFTGKSGRRQGPMWMAAIAQARALGKDELPVRNPPSNALPPPKAWSDKNPAAAARLNAARPLIVGLAEDLGLPVENLLQPDALRRLCWDPPVPTTTASIGTRLAESGARPWQIAATAELLADVIADAS